MSNSTSTKNGSYIFTSESVSEGHPDKLADLISDSILDECLKHDKNSRVACETLIKDNLVVLGGEITTNAPVDFEDVARKAIRTVQYDDNDVFNADKVNILVNISKQSADIAQGVDARAAEGKQGDEQGAGDQGIMFGYATNETPEYLPATIVYAHTLMQNLTAVRKRGEAEFLRPDAKSQVSIVYENGKPVHVDTIVISTQHTEDATREQIEGVCRKVISESIPAEMINDKTRLLINPTGRFVVGGSHGDCGVTGRKIIVDTYGGAARHGGGAFSGKDCSKVDRSGAYMCRWVAKHVVAAGLADKCEIQVGYAIGVAEPVSIMVDTFGTNKIPEERISEIIKKYFSFKPAFIEDVLGLRTPIYTKTTNYGHFTKPDLPWEVLSEHILGLIKEEVNR